MKGRNCHVFCYPEVRGGLVVTLARLGSPQFQSAVLKRDSWPSGHVLKASKIRAQYRCSWATQAGPGQARDTPCFCSFLS